MIPREKGFLWGRITLENGAWQSFGVVKYLKLRYFLNLYRLKIFWANSIIGWKWSAADNNVCAFPVHYLPPPRCVCKLRCLLPYSYSLYLKLIRRFKISKIVGCILWWLMRFIPLIYKGYISHYRVWALYDRCNLFPQAYIHGIFLIVECDQSMINTAYSFKVYLRNKSECRVWPVCDWCSLFRK